MFAWWDSLEAREVFNAGRYLSGFRRELLHKLQSPPEGLVLAQEGLLGYRVGRDSACLDRWNLRNLDQLTDEWALNCKHMAHIYPQRTWRVVSNRQPTMLVHTRGLTYFSSRVWGSAPSRRRTAEVVHSRSRACAPGWERTRSGLWCSVWPCSSSWAFRWRWDPLDLKQEVKQEGRRRDESGKKTICLSFICCSAKKKKILFFSPGSKMCIQDSSIINASGHRELSVDVSHANPIHTCALLTHSYLSFVRFSVITHKIWLFDFV